MWSCSLFFAAAYFYLGGKHFSFSHSHYKIFMLFFNEIGLVCFFISGSGPFSVIHANEDFKIESKERFGFVVVVFYL